MEKCMRCEHDLILEGNFMLSEINGEDLSDLRGKIIHIGEYSGVSPLPYTL